MNSRATVGRFAVHWILLTALLATPVFAQFAGGEFAANMAENSKKLKQYTYLQKTEVYLRGELRTSKRAEVHFDSVSGEKIVVPLNSEDAAEAAPAGPRGRIRSRIVERKKDEMKDYVDRLVGLMGQYLPPNPDRVKAAMAQAQITPPAEGQDARVELSHYLKPGDRVTLSVNAATKKLNQIAIQSDLDGDPVSFLVSFARLPDITNYPATTSIKAEAKALEIRVSTSDYRK